MDASLAADAMADASAGAATLDVPQRTPGPLEKAQGCADLFHQCPSAESEPLGCQPPHSESCNEEEDRE